MSIVENESTGRRLQRARKERNWSQQTLADKLSTNIQNINRWEHDKTLPQPHYRELLCEVFEKSAEDLFNTPPQEEKTMPIWNVRHLRNLCFTGREDVLVGLHDKFLAQPFAQPYALSGLGGIGKTQIALEYAYRYINEYNAVLWVQADYRELLVAEMVALATLLNLPEKDRADENVIVAAVIDWLQNTQGWLLILDNVDDIEMASQFLPSLGRGHILLTTRLQATGQNVKGIEIEKMGREEGALFLLRRAKKLQDDMTLAHVSAAYKRNAKSICDHMGGLPLALDQAAAYIEENGHSLQDYLDLYHSRRSALLHRRGAFSKHDYPKSVATTWSLSFERVEKANPQAADLLRLCAFMHSEAIPEEMIVRGAAELGAELQAVLTDPLLLADAMSELRKYSLVRLNPETKTLTIHRLVQTVLKDEMSRETYHKWAARAVLMLNRAFPEVEFSTRWICQQYLPHVQVCSQLISQEHITFPEATRLLNLVGKYLFERGQYAEAESYLRQALDIREQEMGTQHLDVAQTLHDLATLYRNYGRYEQSEALFLRALTMRKELLGEDHLDVANTLNALAGLHWYKGQYEQAHAFYQTALVMLERLLAFNEPLFASTLNNLALVSWQQGKYKQAELLHMRTLAVRKQLYGADHPSSAISFNNLGLFYWKLGRYNEAEKYLVQSLDVWEKGLGGDHPNTATALNNLGLVYLDQGRYEQAEELLLRSLTIRERKLGPNHSHIAYSFNNLGRLYHKQGHYDKAESFYQRALAIRERYTNYPDLAETLADVAKFYYDEQKYEQAAPLFVRAIAMCEQYQGMYHPDLITTLHNYASLLYATGHHEEAVRTENRSYDIRKRLEEEY